MPVPNPEHLLQQADRLTIGAGAGAPRQVDLRRAISAAYYAVFHAVLAAAADEFVGATRRSTKQYALVYRSIDHRRLREICTEAQKPNLPAKFAEYAPSRGLGNNIRAFSVAFLDLQKKRHAADYDPLTRFKGSDAIVAATTPRTALRRPPKANSTNRKAFLSLLLFQPR